MYKNRINPAVFSLFSSFPFYTYYNKEDFHYEYRDQLLPVSSRYNAVVMQGCLDAGISPQQFYVADEKYRKAYKARVAPVPKKHAPER